MTKKASAIFMGDDITLGIAPIRTGAGGSSFVTRSLLDTIGTL